MWRYHVRQRYFLILLLEIIRCSTSFLAPALTSSCRRRPSFLRISTTPSIETTPTSSIQSLFDLNLLIIDNYDSYTYNLHQIISTFCLEPPNVIQNDASLPCGGYDGIILSPGPGTPLRPKDIGICAEVIRNNPKVPILGVCLGHQTLGEVYNGRSTVRRSPRPMHGLLSSLEILDPEDPLFVGIGEGVEVVRYHSLCVSDLNSPLIATSRSRDDGVIMSLRHEEYPHYGVQFHPESIGMENAGKRLLKNFCRICVEHRRKGSVGNISQKLFSDRKRNRNGIMDIPPSVTTQTFNGKQKPSDRSRTSNEVTIHKIPLEANQPMDTQALFEFLYKPNSSEGNLYWLDSSSQNSPYSKISIMGRSSTLYQYYGQEFPLHKRGFYKTDSKGKQLLKGDIIQFLSTQLLRKKVSYYKTMENLRISVEELPFDFCGGFIGYFSYEIRHLCYENLGSVVSYEEGEEAPPSSTFWRADRSVVYDHVHNDIYLVAVDSQQVSGKKWVLKFSKQIQNFLKREKLPNNQNSGLRRPRNIPKELSTQLQFRPNRSKSTYQRNIKQCHSYIDMGESYELCLTNHIQSQLPFEKKPYNLYKILRNKNPTPYSAYLNIPSQNIALCCSSPELFLHSDIHGKVKTKPIKGTHPRYPSHKKDSLSKNNLQTCEKNRAENLMIVDLLRNDLSRICRKGTVRVPKLMHIESYATVHQMVSTITGVLSEDKTVMDLFSSCFPGGSMTGAPKLRSMDLLTGLEDGVPRGVYSGSLGYISWTGCMQLNIVIRTAVLCADGVSIGAGGAVTALSEEEGEYEEMLLKARAVVEAVREWWTNED